MQDNPVGQAYRYALVNLNPFAVVGPDYSQQDILGELKLYDPETGTGNLTETYLKDRAAMLAWKIKYDSGERDKDDIGELADKSYQDEWDSWTVPDNWKYTDATKVVTFTVDGWSSTDHQIAFGSYTADSFTGGDAQDHLYGGFGDDTLSGGGGNDYVEGNQGNDDLKGEAGYDTLIGGEGDDRLDGGAGNDSLEGGQGYDTYVFHSADKGDDLIRDADGLGKIEVDGQTLTGGSWKTFGRWEQNGIIYNFLPDANGQGDLRITTDGGVITVKDYKKGDLDLALPGQTTPGLVTDRDIVGDKAPKDMDPATPGVQMGYDDLGNPITEGDEPDRADTLNDGPGNDNIRSLGGDDVIHAARGGNDRIDAGSGQDRVEAGDGKDELFRITATEILLKKAA